MSQSFVWSPQILARHGTLWICKDDHSKVYLVSEDLLDFVSECSLYHQLQPTFLQSLVFSLPPVICSQILRVTHTVEIDYKAEIVFRTHRLCLGQTLPSRTDTNSVLHIPTLEHGEVWIIMVVVISEETACSTSSHMICSTWDQYNYAWLSTVQLTPAAYVLVHG